MPHHALGHHHHHHQHLQHYGSQPFNSNPVPYHLHPHRFTVPETPKPGQFLKSLRAMFDGSEATEVQDEQGPTSYSEPYPSQYYPPLPQYPPQNEPKYDVKYEPNHNLAPTIAPVPVPAPAPAPYIPPKYEAALPKYQAAPPKAAYDVQKYKNPAIPASQYQPHTHSSCGSSLLVGCRPQVQTVPCYHQPTYSAPVAYNVGYKPSNPPAYPSPPVYSPLDIHSQPGPPYPGPEPAVSTSRDQMQTGNAKKTPNLRKDSEPEPSNISKKTDESDNKTENLIGSLAITSTTESPIEQRTTESKMEEPTAKNTATITILRPSTEEQIRRLHEKLDTHVENIKKFKEDAGNKLRQAIASSRGCAANYEFDKSPRFSEEPTTLAKWHSNRSMNRDLVQNPAS